MPAFFDTVLLFVFAQYRHDDIGNHAVDHNVIQAARFSFAFVGRWLRAEPVQELYRMFREQRILLYLIINPARQRFAFLPREISAQVSFDLADLLPFEERLGWFENLGLCKFRRRHGNASFLMEMRNLSLVSL